MASADAHVPIAHSSHDPTADSRSELDRLERAVRELIALQRTLRAENGRLRASLEESRREQQARLASMRGLEKRLDAERQRRHDALKRVDDLIGLIEQLDPELATPPGTGR
jgi:chromosome segregation ATPase